MKNLENLTAKELKVIAKEKGLEFKANASAKEMLELLNTPNLPNSDDDLSLEDEKIDDKEDTEKAEIEKPIKSWEYIVITPIKKDWKKYNKWDKIFFEKINEEVKNLIADEIIK